MQLLRGRTTGISTLAISPDSRFLVAASEHAECHVWDLSEAKPKARTLWAGGSSSIALSFPTPTTLIARHNAGWGRYDLAEVNEVTFAEPFVTLTASSIVQPSGTLIKVVSYNTLQILTLVEANLHTLRFAASGLVTVEPTRIERGLPRLWAFDPAGERYLIEVPRPDEEGCRFHLRDAATDGVVATFGVSRRMRPSRPHQWAFAPDGRRLFAIGYQYVVAYDCQAGGPPAAELSPAALGGEFNALAAHPGGRLLAVVEDQRTVSLRDADTLRSLRCYDFAMPRVTCVAFTPDGTRCVIGNSRGKVLLFDVD